MKKIRTFTALMVTLCMSFGLTACGGSNSNKTNDKTNDTQTKENDKTTNNDKTEGNDKTTNNDKTENDNTTPEASGEPGQREATGLDLTACIASEPETIDPTLNSSVDGATYIMHTFEGLMKYVQKDEGDSEITYGQAESYEVSDDNLVYTFKLRDDIYWSDGVPVTANDFVYSWQRLVDPNVASDYCYIIDIVKNSKAIQAGELEPTELGIVAKDDKTLEVTLESPCEYFIDLCAFASTMPLREDIVSDSWTFSPDTYVSNGAYKMTEWEHDSYIKMEPNEYYYDYANLGPDTITWKLMEDDNAMLAAYQSGEIDFINSIPVDEIDTLVADGSLKASARLGNYAVVFNTQEAPFDDPLVRKAFSLAIDRNYIVNNIKKQGQRPGTAWVPTGILDYNDKEFREVGGEYYSVSEDDYAANCEEARKLLADAGYEGGANFPVVEYIYNTNDAHQKIAEALAYMWETELGVQVQLTNQDWNVFLQTRTDGDFQFARHGWVADYNDASNFLDMYTTGNANNYSQWSNEEFDNLIADAITEKDAAKRSEILHQAEDIMMEEMIVAPVYDDVDPYMINDRIANMYHSPMGYFFFDKATLS